MFSTVLLMTHPTLPDVCGHQCTNQTFTHTEMCFSPQFGVGEMNWPAWGSDLNTIQHLWMNGDGDGEMLSHCPVSPLS